MANTYFSALCATEQIPVLATDKENRAYLASAGASFVAKAGIQHSAARSEGAAAVAWARANLDSDAKWVAIPQEGAATLMALFPVKPGIAALGGDKWTTAVRSLVRAHITPISSPAKAAPASGPATRNLANKQISKSLAASLNAVASGAAVPAAAAAPVPIAATAASAVPHSAAAAASATSSG